MAQGLGTDASHYTAVPVQAAQRTRGWGYLAMQVLMVDVLS